MKADTKAEVRPDELVPPERERSTEPQTPSSWKKEWMAGELKHDATKLQRILDDKFVYSYGSEKPYDNATYICATPGFVEGWSFR